MKNNIFLILLVLFSCTDSINNNNNNNNNDNDNIQILTPSNPLILAVGASVIVLKWDASENVTGYKLYRGIDNTQINTLVDADIETIFYSDKHLSTETTYYYQLTSFNDSGESERSTIISATTLPNIVIPDKPQGLRVVTKTDNSIKLCWDHSDNASLYDLYRGTDINNVTTIIAADMSTETYDDRGLNPNTAYFYKVIAKNIQAYSPYSDILSTATTLISASTVTVNQHSAYECNILDITWTQVIGAVTYKLYRGTTAENINYLVYSGPDFNVTKYDGGLKLNTTYYYAVTVSNINGESPPSSANSAKTPIVWDDVNNWNKKYNGPNNGSDKFICCTIDTADNLYVAGDYVKTGQMLNWIIKKYDKNGNEIISGWDKSINGAFSDDDQVSDIFVTSDNYLLVGGYLNNNTDSKDWHLRKYNAAGGDIWDIARASGSGNDYLFGLTADNIGNIYAVGSGTQLVGVTLSDWWIKKFQNDSTEIMAGWDKKLNFNNQFDYARKVVIDLSGNIYVVGYGQNAGGSGQHNWIIKKFSADGSEITSGWDKIIDGGFLKSDCAYDIEIDSNNNVIIAGSYGNNVPELDWWLLKFTEAGAPFPTWPVGGFKINKSTGNLNDEILGITVDGANNIYLAGYATDRVAIGSGKDMVIQKIDKDGNLIWEKAYHGGMADDSACDICLDSKGDVFVVGFCRDGANDNGWIKKLVQTD